MKKFSFLIALSLLVGAIAFTPVKAQDDKQAEAERVTYEACYDKEKKNMDKCIPLAEELIAKYPSSRYADPLKKLVANYKFNTQLTKVTDNFQNSLKAYYGAPDGNKLDQLFGAGDEFLKVQPGNQFVVGQLALAGAHGSIGQIYKNYDRVKTYGEEALKLFEPATPPEGWEKANWDNLREIVSAQVNQFLGFRLIETKGDKQQALGYLTKSTMVKGKDGAGWKDPNNYWLRAGIYQEEYQALRAEYDKLPDDQKTGDPGKELLKKVNDVMDNKLIPEYARVMATATKPETKPLADAAKGYFDAYWNYRTKAPEKAAEYVKSFSADPTVAGPPIPVKVEDADATPLQAPTTPAAGSVKLTSSGGAATGTGHTASGTSTTSKATTTKSGKTTKAAPKGRRRKP
ncbi:MAG: hypothetical protein JST85_20865 [Acidobacteria bacterium]|nr:hypothetical protein [Acidobacteriota bacterium]